MKKLDLYEEAKKLAIARYKRDQRSMERKILMGVEREFKISVVADPICNTCHGDGVDMEPGVSGRYESYEVICHCASQRKIIR